MTTDQQVKPGPGAGFPGAGFPVPPRARRLPCALAFAASLGVLATSLAAAPPAVLIPAGILWLAAIAAGAWLPAAGPGLLTCLAVLTKAITVIGIIWAVTHPQSPIGPHTVTDWIPLGSLNAATGLWLLRVIRHQAG